MSNNDPSGQGEQPVPETQPELAPEAGAQPQEPAQQPGDIDTIEDLAALSNILWPDPDTDPVAPQEPQEEPQSDDRPEADPPEQGEEHPEGEEKRGSPDRISLKALKPEERELMAEAVDLVRQGKAESVKDALRQILPQEPSPPQQQPQAETPQAPKEEAPPPPGSVEAITAELKELREQRRKSIEDFDRAAEADITERIEDKVIELQVARETAKESATRERQEAENHAAQVATVKERYPESEDPESPFSQRLQDAFDLAHYRKDPVLAKPDYLLKLAERVAGDLGTATAPRPKASPPPSAPARPPVGGVLPAAAPSPRPSPDQVAAMIENASLEELDALLWKQG